MRRKEGRKEQVRRERRRLEREVNHPSNSWSEYNYLHPYSLSSNPRSQLDSNRQLQMPPQYLGITPPISIAPPTQRDLEVTSTLIKELRDRGCYEGAEDGRTRYASFSLLIACFLSLPARREGFSPLFGGAGVSDFLLTVLPLTTTGRSYWDD